MIPIDLPWHRQPPYGTPPDLADPLNGGVAAWWPSNEGGGPYAWPIAGPRNRLSASGGNPWATTARGTALNLTGSNYWISDALPLDPGAGPFAASLWFYASSSPASKQLLNQQGSTEGYTGTGRSWLAVSAAGVVNSFLGGAGVSGTTTIQAGQWYHAAVRYDGSTLSLWLDGVKEASRSTSTNPPESATGPVVVGATKTYTSNWSGQIADVRISPYAPDDGEILSLYAEPHRAFAPERIWLPAASAPPPAATTVRRTLYSRAGSRGVA